MSVHRFSVLQIMLGFSALQVLCMSADRFFCFAGFECLLIGFLSFRFCECLFIGFPALQVM